MTPQKISLIQWLDRHLGKYEAVLLDIDGVLLNGRKRLKGSKRLLDWFQQHAIPFFLLTNDGNHSTREKADRLNCAGLPIAPDQIVSCGHAIRPLVQTMVLAGKRFFVMGDTGVPCYAQSAGLKVTRDVSQLPKCSGVIIGEEHYDWEPVINAVINYFIDHPRAPLIVPNPDEFYPGPILKIHVAAGGVGRFMQNVLKAYGVEIRPIYLGKPHVPIFELAQHALERKLCHAIESRNIMMVGDNMASDIAGGLAMGYVTALMLTGVTHRSALDHWAIIPDLVFEAL